VGLPTLWIFSALCADMPPVIMLPFAAQVVSLFFLSQQATLVRDYITIPNELNLLLELCHHRLLLVAENLELELVSHIVLIHAWNGFCV